MASKKKDIQKFFVDLFRDDPNLGMTMIRENQNGHAPQLPYATINIKQTNLVGIPSNNFDGNTDKTETCSQKEWQCEIKVLGPDAFDKLSLLPEILSSVKVRSKIRALNFSCNLFGQVMDISTRINALYEERAIIEVSGLFTETHTEEESDYFTQVEFEVFDESINVGG